MLERDAMTTSALRSNPNLQGLLYYSLSTEATTGTYPFPTGGLWDISSNPTDGDIIYETLTMIPFIGKSIDICKTLDTTATGHKIILRLPNGFTFNSSNSRNLTLDDARQSLRLSFSPATTVSSLGSVISGAPVVNTITTSGAGNTLIDPTGTASDPILKGIQSTSGQVSIANNNSNLDLSTTIENLVADVNSPGNFVINEVSNADQSATITASGLTALNPALDLLSQDLIHLNSNTGNYVIDNVASAVGTDFILIDSGTGLITRTAYVPPGGGGATDIGSSVNVETVHNVPTATKTITVPAGTITTPGQVITYSVYGSDVNNGAIPDDYSINSRIDGNDLGAFTTTVPAGGASSFKLQVDINIQTIVANLAGLQIAATGTFVVAPSIYSFAFTSTQLTVDRTANFDLQMLCSSTTVDSDILARFAKAWMI